METELQDPNMQEEPSPRISRPDKQPNDAIGKAQERASSSAAYGTFNEEQAAHPTPAFSTNRQVSSLLGSARMLVEQNLTKLESMRDAEAGEMTKLAGDGAAGGTAAGAQARYMKPLTQEAYERTLRLRNTYTESDKVGGRAKMVTRLDRRIENKFDGVCDKLANEFFITGQLWFDFFSPRKLGGHGVFFTWTFLLTCVTVFAYMGGDYPYWQLKDRNTVQTEVFDMYTTDPRGMLYWFWTQEQSSFTFDFNFLLLWGGRWLPAIDKGQWWRWGTSIVLHENHDHIMSNMALFMVLSYFMEQKYGTMRVTLIAFIAGVGGNFFSAIFEADCMLVMGASGLIFGIFGLYTTDLIVNFDSIHRPVMQGICVITLLIYFAWSAANSNRHNSDVSHLGGLICGLFPSFLVIPSFKRENDWEAVLPFIALGVLFVAFIVFPLYIYLHMLPMTCDR